MRTLELISGPAAGQSIDIDRELVIGREDADVTIPDSEVSRRHLVVRPVEHGVEVEDLGSLNGTFLDGERIREPVTIVIRGVITLGTSEMRVDVALPQAAPRDQVTMLSSDPAGLTIQARIPFSTQPALEQPPLPPADVRGTSRLPVPALVGIAAVVVAALVVAAILLFL